MNNGNNRHAAAKIAVLSDRKRYGMPNLACKTYSRKLRKVSEAQKNPEIMDLSVFICRLREF